MKLDYILYHLFDNYKTNNGTKYDYVESYMIINKNELCDEIGRFLNMTIIPGEKAIVTREQLDDVWRLLRGRKDLMGMYGDDFLNDF